MGVAKELYQFRSTRFEAATFDMRADLSRILDASAYTALTNITSSVYAIQRSLALMEFRAYRSAIPLFKCGNAQ
jgi:hypothetical protein